MTGSEILETLSSNIKLIRKEKSWTQEKLAEECGLSSQAINAIEGKRRWPGEDTISKIATALDVEVYQLFVPKDSTPVIIEETPENEKIRSQITLSVVDEVRNIINHALDKIESVQKVHY